MPFTAASLILFERRLGCLSDNPPDEVKRFIQASHDVMDTSMKLTVFPVKVAEKLNLPMWKKFSQGMDVLFETGWAIFLFI